MWLKKAVDPKELSMGREVEKEHQPTIAIIKSSIKDNKITLPDEEIYGLIARDHLNEFTDYYTQLSKMESEAKQSISGAEQSIKEEK